jgi:hypothetical protein
MDKRIVKVQLNELLGIGFTIIVLGLGLAYGLQILGDVKTEMGEVACATDPLFPTYDAVAGQCTNSTDFQVVDSAQFTGVDSTVTAVAKMPEKLPTLVTVIMAAAIITVLLTYLYARFVR